MDETVHKKTQFGSDHGFVVTVSGSVFIAVVFSNQKYHIL